MTDSEHAATRRPYVIGVTGNIACGKTTVTRWLAELGVETIDADLVYHSLIAPGSPLVRAIIERFGEGVAAPDGGIDRRALGAIVFSDPAALADLDRLTHPAVIARIQELIGASKAPVVAVDAVKLVESGLDRSCDEVWLVVCMPEQQIERLMQRNGFSREEAERRVRAQPDLEAKRSRSDVVIDNSGDLERTREQVLAAWDRIQHALSQGTATCGRRE